MTRVIAIYIISTLLMFLILGFQYFNSFKEFLDTFIINLCYLIAFSAVSVLFLKTQIVRLRYLILTCFLFNSFFGLAYITSINEHTNLLFQYVPSDAPFYDEAGREVSNLAILEGIQSLVAKTKYGYDDMGMVAYVGSIYKLYDSPLLVKLINLIVNLFSTFMIFKLARGMMVKKYAILSALFFSISSFNIWFLIAGLKEPVMLFLLLIYFYALSKHLKTRKTKYLIVMLIFGPLLLFFRTALLLFILIASFSGYLLRQGLGLKKLAAITIMILLTTATAYQYKDLLSIYLKRENASVYKNEQETASKINTPLVLAAGVLGPFPTVIPKTDKKYADVSTYAASLILKITISFFFLFGIYYLFLENHYAFIPIAVFCIIEILALTAIDSTFKLRYALPHFPFVYILGLLGMNRVLNQEVKHAKFLTQIAIGFQMSSIALVLAWNFLRL